MADVPEEGASLVWLAQGVGGETEAAGSVPASAETLAVYDLHSRLLYRLALAEGRDAELARDAVQEAFLRFHEARRNGQTIRSVRSWLAKVVINFIRDHARRSSRLTAINEASGAAAAEGPPGSARELELRIRSLLSPREFECVQLRLVGYKYFEIAEILGLRPGSVACLLSRALRKLESIRGDVA